MIVVTNPERLEEFGFKKNGHVNHGKPIYARKISRGTDSTCYLYVNPFGWENTTPNEMALVVQVEIAKCDVDEAAAGDEGFYEEWDLPLDAIVEMLEAGVIKRVPDVKKAVA